MYFLYLNPQTTLSDECKQFSSSRNCDCHKIGKMALFIKFAIKTPHPINQVSKLKSDEHLIWLTFLNPK